MATVNGQPAVRVTTSSAHGYSTNDLVRIDGVVGSTQLNNNLYYVHVINSTQFDLYTEQYDPALGAINYPVTNVNSYVSGGYVSMNEAFVLYKTIATDTSSTGNYITVPDTEVLTLGIPLVFTEENVAIGDPTLGGLIAGQIYYFKSRNPENSTQFTVSATIDGDAVTLTTDSGSMRVCQWQQDNVDRLWVTVNGYRVPSSSLRINTGNYISILTEIVAGDEIVITSMMPSATPNEEVYVQYVNQLNEPTVYRANSLSRTWLTQPFYNTDDTIYVNDVEALTNTIEQNVTTPAAVSGIFSIGLEGNKNLYSSIVVYNNTKSATISDTHYTIELIDLAPILKITDGAYIDAGDSLTITILEGNVLYIKIGRAHV